VPIQVHTANQSGISEIAVSVSAALGNGVFTDNGVRIFSFSSSTVNNPPIVGSTNYFTDSPYTEQSDPGVEGTKEATIRLGVLRHNLINYNNFLPAGPNRSGDTGTQYFTFAFRRQVVANFNINIVSSTGISGFWIAAPGTQIDSTSTLNGWLNASETYAGSGIPGANTGAGGNGSNGCAFTSGDNIPLQVSINGSFRLTLGTVNLSSSTGNVALVRVALSAGQTVTSLGVT